MTFVLPHGCPYRGDFALLPAGSHCGAGFFSHSHRHGYEFQLQNRRRSANFAGTAKKIVYGPPFWPIPMTDKGATPIFWVINGRRHRPSPNFVRQSLLHLATLGRPTALASLFLSDVDGKPQIYVSLDGHRANRAHHQPRNNRLTPLPGPPDGRMISFSSLVAGKGPHLADLPASPPPGAKWADPPNRP